MAAQIEREKYEEKRIDKIYENLQFYKDKGEPTDFEITVDGLKVVRRTDDLDMFFQFEKYVDPDTKAIDFVLYSGSSNNCTKHYFYVAQPVTEKIVRPDKSEKSDKVELSGVEIDKQVDAKVAQTLKEKEYLTLQQEYKELEKEVADLHKEIEILEIKNEALESIKSPFYSVLGAVGSSVLENFIKGNPKVMSIIPGGEALAGLLDSGTSRNEQENAKPESEISFQPKNNRTSLTDEDQRSIIFVRQLKSQFTKEEFESVVDIIQTLADDKGKIELIITLCKP